MIAHSVIKSGDWHEAASDTVVLDYNDRFIRRKLVTCASGAELMISLENTVSLNAGDGLITEEQKIIEVVAADEDVIEVRADETLLLTRLAWHIGNRHTPCQIAEDHLLILNDHVMEDMLRKLGASVKQVRKPFTPEGGAYGHGRTHAHDHAPPPGSDHHHSHS